jgi:DNA-directed RNA polymerase subunit H (RpoH/RPB5)
MNFNGDIVDTLYRSRKTLLDILKQSGYNTTPFLKFSHKEILEMLKGGEKAFWMDLVKEGDSKAPFQNCRVMYAMNKIKTRMLNWLSKLTNTDAEEYVDPSTTELVVICMEPIVQAFHTASYDLWNKHKLKIRFFEAKHLVINPLEHFLVPRHERVDDEKIPELLKQLFCTSRRKLPPIRYHEDAIARLLGLMPDDVVKIYRPSPTALEYDPYYRVCVP